MAVWLYPSLLHVVVTLEWLWCMQQDAWWVRQSAAAGMDGTMPSWCDVLARCRACAAACDVYCPSRPLGSSDMGEPNSPSTLCHPLICAGNLVLSGSIDASARLWEVRSGRCLSVKTGHTDEVLDVAFNTTGSSFVSASADGTAR